MSRPAPTLLTATLWLALAGSAHAQERFPGIESLMSDEEFSAAGLNKLSPGELEALDRWLLNYTATESRVLLETNEEVKQAERAVEIRARIQQPFEGWSGDTRFVLDNGQIWKQRLDGRYRYSGEDTEVVIEKNFLGFYRLTHVATGRSIGVSRVK